MVDSAVTKQLEICVCCGASSSNGETATVVSEVAKAIASIRKLLKVDGYAV